METNSKRHEVGQQYTHVGDRQLPHLWEEIQRLTARVKELEAENRLLRDQVIRHKEQTNA